jgi:hypothetical protein
MSDSFRFPPERKGKSAKMIKEFPENEWNSRNFLTVFDNGDIWRSNTSDGVRHDDSGTYDRKGRALAESFERTDTVKSQTS